jgi:hypothetical protein
MSPSTAHLLANLVLAAHAAFIAFVALGGLLVARWPKLAWLHLPAVAWGAGISFVGAICPLTPLENALRDAAGSGGYAGGFIEHYLLAFIYPDGLTRGVQIGLGTAALAVNAAAYAWAWRRRAVRRGAASDAAARYGSRR